MGIGKLSYEDIPVLRTRYFGHLSPNQSAFVAGTSRSPSPRDQLPEKLTSTFDRSHPDNEILLRNRQPHNLLRTTWRRLPSGYGLQ